MTLSRWLRDYLYIPLGGNRKSPRRTEVNLFLTMVIGGLWHGAAWTFVFWGFLHGAGLVVERQLKWRREGRGLPRPPAWRSWLLTFNFVCFAWVFFRAHGFGQALDVLERLFTGWGQDSSAIGIGVIAAIAATMAIQFTPRDWWQRLQATVSRWPFYAQGVSFGVVLMLINTLGPSGVAPFIYFQF
jgi:D-alanyl-lipoteichoic acid acyltransferase DltB (MBOAT superfamily)